MRCGRVKADRDVDDVASAPLPLARLFFLVPTSSCLKGHKMDLKQMLILPQMNQRLLQLCFVQQLK